MTHDPDAPRPDEQRATPWREDREAHARLAAEFDEAMRALGAQIIGPDEARLMPATVIVIGEPHDPRPQDGHEPDPGAHDDDERTPGHDGAR